MRRSKELGVFVAAASLTILGGCNGRQDSVASVEMDTSTPPQAMVELQIATMWAVPGDSVNLSVALVATDSGEVAALQGSLRFHPQRLRYAGQVPLEKTMTIVNAADAESASLRMLSFRLDGLEERAAVLRFEVLEGGYTAGLSFEPVLAATPEGGILDLTVSNTVASRPDLVLQRATLASPDAAELAGLAGFEIGGGGPAMVLSASVEIGDCNQDAVVDALDLVAIARVAVGLDPAPMDPSDLRVCDVDGSGSLDVRDVLDVSRFAVGVPTISAPVGFGLEPMALGEAHSCALDGAGRAYCWGAGSSGQLGDGVGTSSEAPVAVTGSHVFTSLAAGESHSCGLDVDGQAWCWGGEASRGTLGDGTLTDSDVPVAVAGGHVFAKLSMIVDDHACGIEASGAAWCWGEQFSEGRLGDGVTTTPQGEPVAVAGGIAFADIAAAWVHTCGLDLDGQAYCWGSGYATTPDPVAVGQTFTQIASGFTHTCALDATGSAYCWGTNEFGQLGDGTGTDSATPVAVAGGQSFARIVAARRWTCGIDLSGQAYCWGENEFGQIGDGTTDMACALGPCRDTPTAVSGGQTFAVVEGGFFHSCGIDDAGARWCWGDNSDGALGLGPGTPLSPVRVSPTATVSMPANTGVQAGGSHACVLAAGEAYCWGDNGFGQLGDGTTTDSNVPVVVQGGAFSTLTAGSSHSCGLDPNFGAHCWGFNSRGQLGNGTTTNASGPVPVGGGHLFLSIDAGADHTCALDRVGVALCWGGNLSGQLGDGTTTNASLPDTVSGGSTYSELAVGNRFTCGLVNGRAFCWGENGFGQLGNGTTTNSSVPVQVAGGLTFTTVATGATSSHACGLIATGEAYCWGSNSSGQIGDGTTTDATVPTPVSGGRTFDRLIVGTPHTCGLEAGTGAMFCWGGNTSGALGDGTRTDRPRPTAVTGGPPVWTDGGAGSGFTCARDGQGSVYCWGSNRSGELSLGVFPRSLVPIEVLPLN